MELLIVTGLSGAGKSLTLDFLEDMNYYCVDNLPFRLSLTSWIYVDMTQCKEDCFRYRWLMFSGFDQVLSDLDDKDIDYKVLSGM